MQRAAGLPSTEPANGASRTVIRRVALSVLGFLAVSLVVPAATRQWADRAQELSLKKDLITDVAVSSTEAIESAKCVVSYCYPEAVAFRNNPDPARSFEVNAAGQRLLMSTREAWLKTGASMDPVFTAYFPGDPVGGRWDDFSTAVTAYIRIASSECGAARDADMTVLRDHFPGIDSTTWTDLIQDIGPDCLQTPETFVLAYNSLGDTFLREREDLIRGIVRANAEGYSSGWRDFFRDLFPL
jgi:hypothetical protein